MSAPPVAAKGRCRVALMGDTQRMQGVEWFMKGGAKERGRVRGEIERLRPDFVILAGDAVGTGSYKPSWNKFRRDYHTLPVWPVLGNHDLVGPDRLCLRYYFESFPHVEGRRWYAIRRPPVLFILLDSNFGSLSAEDSTGQEEWLKAELDRAQSDPEIRGLVVVAHHPPFSVHGGGGNEKVRQRFWDEAVRRPKFVAFFSGHHHNYQHILAEGRHAFVSGGGGSPILLWRRASLPPGAELMDARKSHHFLLLDIQAGGLDVVQHELQPDGRWEAGDRIFLGWPH